MCPDLWLHIVLTNTSFLKNIMRIKFKKYSQNYLTYKLDRANIYANEINKIFACGRRKQNVYRRKRTG